MELDRIDKKMKTASKQLTELVQATGSTLLELTGIGPSGAARLLGDVGDVSRFQSRGHSRRGTVPPRSTPPPVSRTGTGCPGRGPADQPGAAHHGDRAAA